MAFEAARAPMSLCSLGEYFVVLGQDTPGKNHPSQPLSKGSLGTAKGHARSRGSVSGFPGLSSLAQIFQGAEVTFCLQAFDTAKFWAVCMQSMLAISAPHDQLLSNWTSPSMGSKRIE